MRVSGKRTTKGRKSSSRTVRLGQAAEKGRVERAARRKDNNKTTANHKVATPQKPSLDPSTQQVSWVTVDESRVDQRIDNFLVARFKGVPKSHFYRILRKGEIRVNKSRVKPEYRLKEGDLIRVPPLRLAAAKPEVQLSQSLAHYLSNNVLYEDDGLMVINKPAGLAVHGGSQVAFGLIEALRSLRKDCRFLELVHRLDRDTSGCIMVAKKRPVLRFLQACLRQKGGIDKTYAALVAGFWPNHVSVVDAPLRKGEERDGGRVVRVRPDGKASQTEFRVLERFVGKLGDLSLVEAKPITGRTHQIRVHAQWMKMPLLGDEKYGIDELNQAFGQFGGRRLFLHARRLVIPVYSADKANLSAPPVIGSRSGKMETIEVEAPLAPELESALQILRVRG